VELEDVFREYQRAVFAYFLRVTGDRHNAEELTQETFFRACGAALRYRGDGSVRSWLFGIAHRVVLEASRKGLFERATSIDDLDLPVPELDHDRRMDLEQAFGALERSDREALMLVDFLGFSPGEAAVVIAVDAGTFRMRLHRARHRLRDQLEVPTYG
jgi:RNA polymerase sigma factor (sigma-70 family)